MKLENLLMKIELNVYLLKNVEKEPLEIKMDNVRNVQKENMLILIKMNV